MGVTIDQRFGSLPGAGRFPGTHDRHSSASVVTRQSVAVPCRKGVRRRARRAHSPGRRSKHNMKLRYRILSIFAIVVGLAFVALGVTLSYDSPCGANAALPAGSESMKAVVNNCYGSPEVLKLEQLAKPTPADDQLLVKVRAAALNPPDWHTMRRSPYI